MHNSFPSTPFKYKLWDSPLLPPQPRTLGCFKYFMESKVDKNLAPRACFSGDKAVWLWGGYWRESHFEQYVHFRPGDPANCYFLPLTCITISGYFLLLLPTQTGPFIGPKTGGNRRVLRSKSTQSYSCHKKKQSAEWGRYVTFATSIQKTMAAFSYGHPLGMILWSINLCSWFWQSLMGGLGSLID